eukprot:TRINITY_DN1656_c0_g1_i10.p1 TRINITY_DN1656_c0_g1~~TRINITY_DN1656_c0_g1_i10.p1  ORF type:complete len:469 (+),score=138.39 TRINITY_DN1656_c0_g1_i10:35-1408(+)
MVRTIVNQAFAAFSPLVNKEALAVLVDVICAQDGDDESDGGDEDDLKKNSKDGEDEEEQDGEGDDNDGDGRNKGKGESDDEDEDEGDSKDEDEDEKENQESEDEDKFSKVARKSKGDQNGHDKADSGEDEEEEEEEEESLSDEAMFKLDASISQVLATMIKGKKEHAALNTADIHFRYRVLDLLSVFLKNQSSNPLVFNVIHPLLLRFIGTPPSDKTNLEFLQKVDSLLVSLFHNSMYPKSLSSSDVEYVRTILEQCFAHLYKSKTIHHEKLISMAITYLLKVLLGSSDVNTMGDINTVQLEKSLSRSLELFLMKKHKVTTVFFNELFKKLPKIGWFFLPTLCSGVGKGKDLFVNFSVLNFVDQLLKNKNFHKKDDHGTDADALSLTKLLPSVAGAFMRFMKLDKPMDGKRARGALRSLLGVVQLSLLYFTLPETQELKQWYQRRVLFFFFFFFFFL